MKKIAAFLVLFLMIFTFFAVPALAEGEEPLSAISIIALAAAVVIAGALVWLYKVGKINANGITAIKDVLNQVIQYTIPESMFDTLAKYAAKAVAAVEQLVKSGQLEKTDDGRKEKAMGIVEQYAVADGLKLTENEQQVVDTLIEAEVGTTPHKPPN